LEERNEEVVKIKLEADKQLNYVKTQLQGWIEMANKLTNSKADFEQWR